MADNEKLSIIRGDSEEIEVVFTDDNGEFINLEGKVVFFTVKDPKDVLDDNIKDDKAKIKKTITEHTEPSVGKTKILLTKEDTKIPPQDYVYDLQLKDGDNITSAQSAIMEIVQEITNREDV